MLIAWHKVYLEGAEIDNSFLLFALIIILYFIREMTVITGNYQTENSVIPVY